MKVYLKDFFIFINVVEADSLSKAAMLMGVSISSVSKRLSSLEEYLNTTLFERSTHGVKLTPLGKKAYIKSKEITKTFSNFIDEIRGEEVSRLNVYIDHTDGVIPFIDWIQSYVSMENSLSFNVHSAQSRCRRDYLQIDDIIITTEQSNYSMAVHRKLRPIKRTICASPSLNINNDINKLDYKKTIFYTPDINEKMILKHIKNDKKVELKSSMNTDNINIALDLINKKNVIACGLPEYVTASLCHEGVLQEIMPDWFVEPIQYYIAWKGRRFYKKNFTEFIRHIENCMNELLSL